MLVKYKENQREKQNTNTWSQRKNQHTHKIKIQKTNIWVGAHAPVCLGVLKSKKKRKKNNTLNYFLQKHIIEWANTHQSDVDTDAVLYGRVGVKVLDDAFAFLETRIPIVKALVVRVEGVLLRRISVCLRKKRLCISISSENHQKKALLRYCSRSRLRRSHQAATAFTTKAHAFETIAFTACPGSITHLHAMRAQNQIGSFSSWAPRRHKTFCVHSSTFT